MSKKKILFITSYTDGFDGWSTMSSNFINGLKRDYEITLLVKKDIRNKETKNVFPILEFESYINPLSYFKEIRNLEKIFLMKEDFDMVFCSVEPYLPIASSIKKRLKIKKLYLIGAGTYIYSPFKLFPFSIYNKFFTKSISNLIVISNFTKKKASEWYKKEISVVSLGVNTEKFHPIQIKKESKSFLFVGQQKERKGIDILLLAFKDLLNYHPDSKLYIIGSKINFWEEFSKSLNLEKNVFFVGKVSHNDLLRYFSKCICHVLPSKNKVKTFYKFFKFEYFEGFGLVHLEANACGIPSIGSKGTANEEVIINGKSGFLCKQSDYKEISKKMRLLIEDKNLRNKMNKFSLEHAKKNTWKEAVKKLERYLKD